MIRDPVKHFLMNNTIVKISKNYIVGLVFEVPFSKGNYPLYKKELDRQKRRMCGKFVKAQGVSIAADNIMSFKFLYLLNLLY